MSEHLSFTTSAIEGVIDFMSLSGPAYPLYRSILRGLVEHMGKAPKFLLPEDGIFFDKNTPAMGETLYLPYPVIVCEMPASHRQEAEGSKSTRRVFLAVEWTEMTEDLIRSSFPPIWAFLQSAPHPRFNRGGVIVFPINYYDGQQNWLPSSVAGFIPPNPTIETTRTELGSILLGEMGHLWQDTVERNGGDIKSEIALEVSNECMAVLHLCAVLNCRNVKPRKVLAPEKLNKKRAKSEKLPFYEYHVLEIEQPNLDAAGEPRVSGVGGSHRSPRMHLRRGHIRRYATYSIWINAMVVGVNNEGVVEKAYKVKPTNAKTDASIP